MLLTFLILLIVVPLGFFFPSFFAELKPSIPYLLGVIMFSMGVSLSKSEIMASLKSWKLVVIGVGLQFLLMPFLAYLSGYYLGFGSSIFIGMLLVGCSPGGTASMLSFI